MRAGARALAAWPVPGFRWLVSLNLTVRTMSIAISATIHPSVALRLAHGALCLAVLACVAWSGPGVAGALLCVAGFAGAVSGWRLVKPARIDISAVGQIRLTVYHQRDVPHAGIGQAVRLLPDSTLWPGLLVLRLEDDSGRVHRLIVLPDSAAPDVRRRLALAARSIAAAGAGVTKKNPANP